MQPKTEQEIIELIKKSENSFEPGEKMDYSNSGFLLLTFILERVYEKPFSELVKEKIANPIGLKNTRLGGRINPQNNESRSYTFLHNSWQRADEADISQLLGTGGIVSTPTDLLTFSYALFSGKLLSENSLQQMKSVQDHCQTTEMAYGMGLIQMSTGFGHGGGVDNFNAIFVYFPDSDISFVLTANGKHFNFCFSEIAKTLFNVIYNEPFEIPEFTTFDAADVDLSQFVGIYDYINTPSSFQMTISVRDNQLFGQGTGQPAFPLEMTGENRFENRPADIVVEFNPTDNTMVMQQGDNVVNFEKFPLFDVDLNQFVGVYANPQIPWQITITNVDNRLFGYATGQHSFPLVMTGENKLENRLVDLVLEFNLEDNTMILRQGDVVLDFERE